MSGTANIITKSTKYYIVSNTCVTILLEILSQKAIIYTRTTDSTMRENLSIIDTCIAKINSDIGKLN